MAKSQGSKAITVRTVVDEVSYLIDCEIARRDFWEFCLFYDRVFFEKRPFLKQIADGYMRIFKREIRRLAVSMPPRAGKSYITSLYCAWVLGRRPDQSVMRNCCTATLYRKLSYDTREIMRSQKYHDIFPGVVLSEDKQAVEGWSTVKAIQVSYFGAGVGGSIIGFGASEVAISDDLFKSFEEAVSEKIRDKTISWYDGTHGSRQEKECPVIDIGTRWSKKDVIGRQTLEGFYDQVITVSALDEKGESFCSEVKTTAEYLDIRARTSSEIWNAEYMQSPIEASGTLFTREDLKRFKMSELKLWEEVDGKREQLFESVLGYIDVADEGTDRLAFITGYVFPGKVYITDVIFTADNIDVTEPLCAGLIERLDHDFVRVESNNQGGGFIRLLRQHVRRAAKVLPVKNSTNKHTRILIQYGFIKQHFYWREDIERNSPYELFIQELLDYTKAGKTTKDDAPDATAGLAKFISSYLPNLFKS